MSVTKNEHYFKERNLETISKNFNYFGRRACLSLCYVLPLSPISDIRLNGPLLKKGGFPEDQRRKAKLPNVPTLTVIRPGIHSRSMMMVIIYCYTYEGGDTDWDDDDGDGVV